MVNTKEMFIKKYGTRFRMHFRWLILLSIVLLALLIRFALIPNIAYMADLEHFGDWVNLIRQYGLFHFYDLKFHAQPWDRTYPALFTILFQIIALFTNGSDVAWNPVFIFLIKLIPILFDLGFIVAAYIWIQKNSVLRYVFPLLFAIYPGLIVVSAWWGQYEACFVLSLVVSLIALNRNKPLTAWILFAIAVLFKQPALAWGPLLLILTFRRYGRRVSVLGIGISMLIVTVFTLPFVIASGLKDALDPFIGMIDAFPYISNNAYNIWYAYAYLKERAPMPLFHPAYRDSVSIGFTTAKTVGFIVFACYVIWIMGVAWKQYRLKREFVFASALFMAFFMLPTQSHERYIYPAAVFALFAAVQDRRFWLVAGVMAITFTYNVLAVVVPASNGWPITAFGVSMFAFPTAILNILILLLLTGFVLLPSRQKT